MKRPLLALLAALAAGGCVARYTTPDPAYAPARPSAEPANTVVSGSIYQQNTSIRLYEDVSPRRIGDVLTVVLVESTNATKEASTATKKENDIQLDNPTLFGVSPQVRVPGSLRTSRGPLPPGTTSLNMRVDASSAQEFSGSGTSKQSNSLKGAITVTVAEVLPNGNLVVRGEKIVAINDGDEYVRLQGIVRPQDIAPDNTVLSTKVANARISYGGSGTLADSNRHGWLSRFFLAVWPF
jgi:flagellar L-ring protein precursor FlgH